MCSRRISTRTRCSGTESKSRRSEKVEASTLRHRHRHPHQFPHASAAPSAATYPLQWTPLHTRPKAAGGGGPPGGPPNPGSGSTSQWSHQGGNHQEEALDQEEALGQEEQDHLHHPLHQEEEVQEEDQEQVRRQEELHPSRQEEEQVIQGLRHLHLQAFYNLHAHRIHGVHLIDPGKSLPKLMLPSNYKACSILEMRQLLESWYDRCTFAVATWRGDAQRYWLEQILDHARTRHDQWLQSTPSQRASLEPAYILGDRKNIPEARNAVESVLRTELLDAIPKSIAEACMRHAYCTAELIVWYVMKQLILPHDINEVTMQRELLTPPKVTPSTLEPGVCMA